MRLLSFAAVAFFGAGLTRAQFSPSISNGCQSTLSNLLASPDTSCLNLSAFLSVAFRGTDSSIISTVNNWATGLCGVAPCTNDIIAAVVTNITSGCSTELNRINGFASFPVNRIIQAAQTAYPTARSLLCLQDSSANQLCVTQTLTNVESLLGTLSLNNFNNVISTIRTLDSVPANITCTDCIKQSYNIIRTDFPSTVGSLTPVLEAQCGTNFTDGVRPAEITEFNSPRVVNGGLGLFSSRGGMWALLLIILSDVFGLLM